MRTHNPIEEALQRRGIGKQCHHVQVRDYYEKYPETAPIEIVCAVICLLAVAVILWAVL
jgi:hypothetical protein